MKPLYTQEQFNNSNANDKLPCECYQCGATFFKQKRAINKVIRNIPSHLGKFCSSICDGLSKTTKQQVICTNCGLSFNKTLCEIKKSKLGNHFCSNSCNATYCNTHKTHGTRRSKLEVYLEQELPPLYPKLNFHFNRKDTIGSELDIYIPSLSLAFELNGIFHYEPIFGSKNSTRFNQTIFLNQKLVLIRKLTFVLLILLG